MRKGEKIIKRQRNKGGEKERITNNENQQNNKKI